MACFVNAFARLVLQSLPHLMTSEKEHHFRDKKGFADKLNAECDQQFYYKEL
jgi:hypothetical protein